MSSETINSSMNIAIIGIGNYGKKRLSSLAKYSTKIANLYLVDLDFNGFTSEDVLLVNFKNVIFKKSLDRDVMANIDLAFISVPNFMHYSLINKLCDSNIKVFVEKPLCINENEVSKLTQKSNSFKDHIRMGSNLSYFPSFMKLKELVKDKNILSAKATIGHSGQTLNAWNTDISKSGGGTLLDNGIHCLSYLSSFLGELSFFNIDQLSFHSKNIEDEITLSLKSKGCQNIKVTSSWKRSEGYADIEVITDKGTYIADAFEDVVHFESNDGITQELSSEMNHRSIEFETNMALNDLNSGRWSNFNTIIGLHSIIFKTYSSFEN